MKFKETQKLVLADKIRVRIKEEMQEEFKNVGVDNLGRPVI